jgi:hypothetical protein
MAWIKVCLGLMKQRDGWGSEQGPWLSSRPRSILGCSHVHTLLACGLAQRRSF